MAFSEKVKKEARKLSDGKCVMCKREIALEIHHIIPQEENGSDELENAAPLCANCHEIYGGNPTKRKLIKQLRDNWYERVKEASNNIDDLVNLHRNPDEKMNKIAIYHAVYENETFEEAASTLFGLVANAQEKFPGSQRYLYLDIDGHRNKAGGFDNDMFELQTDYMVGFLMEFLTEVCMPLGRLKNKKKQRDDIPDEFRILSSEKEKQEFIKNIEGKVVYFEQDS